MRNYVKDKLKTSLKEIENKIKREIGTKRERERKREEFSCHCISVNLQIFDVC